MSIEAMALALHHSQAKGASKLVLLGIANHYGDGGSWPTIETLAKYANCTERNVQLCLKELEALGEISIEAQQGGLLDTRADRRPNRYEIKLACPPSCDGSVNHRERGEAHFTPSKPRGEAHFANGVKPTSPKPSVEPSDKELTAFNEKFDQFWSIYPRKVSRGYARTAYQRALRKADHETILSGLRRWIAVPENVRDQKFIPHPATWLNGECWEDQPIKGKSKVEQLFRDGDIDTRTGLAWGAR